MRTTCLLRIVAVASARSGRDGLVCGRKGQHQINAGRAAMSGTAAHHGGICETTSFHEADSVF